MAKKAVTIKLDEDSYEAAKFIFKKCGLNFSTAVNIFLNMTLQHDGLPFKVELCKLNEETEKALAEDNEEMSTPYDNFDDMLKAIHASA